ncbi:hypothetical protein BABINDRAFT_161512 [Babjeviella inositovora NRRL Y-12698]|uniref:Uncharacterized protein n=1 Tax=Babjeviella inositovora NRRL Y-12698 TaxID=984486 RepID=A0A1E3QQP4_9ASCO|nr:uncharacterized protein BABINDRAFT_161512 [Babjeviella inositovora NRRL Y-12698]ODQ79824.1 hypothetical protein BABINDRAFT_161512 [Babjeviella inositovora NRRL Y-12698]
MDSIFTENLSKRMYLDLKQLEQKVNDKVLKAALMRRGAESIRRTLKLREITPHFLALYQQGSIGDELFKNFEIHSRLQEEELKEVAMEAESIQQGWATTFFPIVQEICFNEALRRRLNVLDDRGVELNKLWNGLHATATATAAEL